MKIIIPMAGRGSRLRPQTLITPKPLITVAGKTILEQLINDVVELVNGPVNEMVFIIGPSLIFDKKIVSQLKRIAHKYNSKAIICRQLKALGTGHAVMCAKKHLKGKAFVIYPDTLVKFDKSFNEDSEAVIWTKKVKNPDIYGVVKLNSNKEIVDLVEHPKKFVSNLAVIGVYYFRKIELLKDKLNEASKSKKDNSKEFYINQGILGLIKSGKKIDVGCVSQWLDCGNVPKAINANKIMLNSKMNDTDNLASKKYQTENSKIIQPCQIGNDVIIVNSTIGPHVSVGSKTKIVDSKISNSIVRYNCVIKNADINNSMIGDNCVYDGLGKQINIGDFSQIT